MLRWICSPGHCRNETRCVGQEEIVLPALMGLPKDGPSYHQFLIAASYYSILLLTKHNYSTINIYTSSIG